MQSKSEHFFFRMQHFHMSGCSRSADTQQIIFKMFIFHRYCVINSCPEMQRRKNRIDKLSWIIKTTTTFFNLHFRLLVWCLLMMLTLILLLFFCFYFCSAPIAQQNCIFKRMKILTYAHGTSDAALNHFNPMDMVFHYISSATFKSNIDGKNGAA